MEKKPTTMFSAWRIIKWARCWFLMAFNGRFTILHF
jgi:hypothetical protein